MKKYKRSGIYARVVLCFIAILLAMLLAVGIIIDQFCMNFIKEQRRQYNTQILDKTKYELRDLYAQVSQLLTTLANTQYFSEGSVVKEDIFLKLKEELEFEQGIKDEVYRSDFQGFSEGVLFYYGDHNYYYVGDSVVPPGYSFSRNPYFQSLPADLTECRVIGPMIEDYKPANISKDQVIGYIKKKNSLTYQKQIDAIEGEPFVMVSVRLSKIDGILDRMLSKNKGYMLADANGRVILSSGAENLNPDSEEISRQHQALISGQSNYQTSSKNGMLVTSIYLNEYQWVLSTVDSEKALFKDINALIQKVAMWIVLCGAMGILAAVCISRKVLFPIELLKRMVYEIEEDDETYLQEGSKDEVGEISSLINEMKKRIRELNAKQYILEVREREAQLRMLQSQINPHFLHNTLDNIYCIAQIEEIEPIITLTSSLSDMMRYSVNNRDMFVSLQEEIHHVQAYLEIINIRYEDCIHLELGIPEELLYARVNKLLLQPIVENACIHGILPKKHGVIVLTAVREKGEMTIRVQDDGVGISPEVKERLNEQMQQKVRSARTPENKGFGIALVNVNDRIKLLDGQEYGITIESSQGAGSCVVIQQKYRE